MTAGGIRLELAAAQHGKGREIRNAEVHEPDARELFGGKGRAKQFALDELAAGDGGKFFTRIFELRADDVLGSVDWYQQGPLGSVLFTTEGSAQIGRAV